MMYIFRLVLWSELTSGLKLRLCELRRLELVIGGRGRVCYASVFGLAISLRSCMQSPLVTATVATRQCGVCVCDQVRASASECLICTEFFRRNLRK